MSQSAAPTRVRFVVVGLTTLAAVLLYLDRVCLAVAESDIAKDAHLSNDEASWLLSAFFWSYALAQVPAGWLSDRFGARFVLAAYIAGWSIFTGLMSLADSFAALFLLRFACGLAQAGAYPTSAALVSRWVPFSARALASGIVSTGGRVGGVLGPTLTVYLMAAFLGWRPVMFVYGLAGVVVAGLFWLGTRTRPGDHPGCNEAEVALIESGRGPSPSLRRDLPAASLLMPILRSRSLWLSSLSQFGTNVGWAFLITRLPRYLEEAHSVPLLERGRMASLPILVGMAGMLSGGWITDALTRRLGVRWGRALPMSLTRFGAMAAFMVATLLDSPWTVIAPFARWRRCPISACRPCGPSCKTSAAATSARFSVGATCGATSARRCRPYSSTASWSRPATGTPVSSRAPRPMAWLESPPSAWMRRFRSRAARKRQRAKDNEIYGRGITSPPLRVMNARSVRSSTVLANLRTEPSAKAAMMPPGVSPPSLGNGWSAA